MVINVKIRKATQKEIEEAKKKEEKKKLNPIKRWNASHLQKLIENKASDKKLTTCPESE